MAYLISVNRTRRNKLPKDAPPAQWAAYNDAFINCELSAGEIASEIRAGHAIAAQHNGRRKLANWQLAQHVGIDLDDGTRTLDEIVNKPLVTRHAAIVHTTASHTPQHGRYRVLFLLSEPITHPEGYTRLVEALLRAFKTADPHCKDASRLFFGAADCALLLAPYNVLTPDDIGDILTTYPPAEASAPLNYRPGARRRTAATPDDDGPIILPAHVSPVRLDAHCGALLDRIHNAPHGTKWATLRDISITFGGYVASGYYSENEARQMLRGAIEARRATVASMPAAYDTIDRGLAYGALSPLYYRQRVTTPPPVRQDMRWLIDDRIKELEAAILAADMDTPDFDDMTREYSFLMDRLNEAR